MGGLKERPPKPRPRKPRAKKPPAPKPIRPPGRPPKYDPHMVRTVEAWSWLGFDNEEMARRLEIHVATLYAWFKQFPELHDAAEAGREMATASVIKTMYQTALGYENRTQKLVKKPDGSVEPVTLIEKLPPNFSAQAFIVKNRDKSRWSDTQKIEIDHAVTVRRALLELADE